jgi:hypothetical protein
MKRLISTLSLAALLAVGAPAAAAQVSFGIRIGPPPRPRVVHVVPRRPAPGYVWVSGYWYPVRGRYVWHDGYWTRPPYANARWIGPRYQNGRFYDGYWDGSRGRYDHDYRYDGDRGRGRSRY